MCLCACVHRPKVVTSGIFMKPLYLFSFFFLFLWQKCLSLYPECADLSSNEYCKETFCIYWEFPLCSSLFFWYWTGESQQLSSFQTSSLIASTEKGTLILPRFYSMPCSWNSSWELSEKTIEFISFASQLLETTVLSHSLSDILKLIFLYIYFKVILNS